MKTTLKLSRLLPLCALLGVLSVGFLGTGCASTSTKSSTGEYVDDSVITAKIQTALLEDDTVKSYAISVTTFKNVVQLSGFVNNELQRAAAGRIAAGVSGVQQVHNNLIIKSAAFPPPTRPRSPSPFGDGRT
jgi:hyperosmotically inducible protein